MTICIRKTPNDGYKGTLQRYHWWCEVFAEHHYDSSAQLLQNSVLESLSLKIGHQLEVKTDLSRLELSSVRVFSRHGGISIIAASSINVFERQGEPRLIHGANGRAGFRRIQNLSRGGSYAVVCCLWRANLKHCSLNCMDVYQKVCAKRVAPRDRPRQGPEAVQRIPSLEAGWCSWCDVCGLHWFADVKPHIRNTKQSLLLSSPPHLRLAIIPDFVPPASITHFLFIGIILVCPVCTSQRLSSHICLSRLLCVMFIRVGVYSLLSQSSNYYTITMLIISITRRHFQRLWVSLFVLQICFFCILIQLAPS